MRVTDVQIRQLEMEAIQAGDMLQAALCRIACGGMLSQGPHDAYYSSLEWGGRHEDDAETQRDARAECDRVIEDARAQR